MNRHKIDEIPSGYIRNSKQNNNRLQQLLIEFYESEDDYNEIEFDHGEYATSQSLYSGVKKAIEALDLPIRAVMVRGGVYLRRED